MAKPPRQYSPPESVETVIDGKTYTGSYHVRDDYVHVTGPGGASSGPVRIGLTGADLMARLVLGELVMKAKLHGGYRDDDE